MGHTHIYPVSLSRRQYGGRLVFLLFCIDCKCAYHIWMYLPHECAYHICVFLSHLSVLIVRHLRFCLDTATITAKSINWVDFIPGLCQPRCPSCWQILFVLYAFSVLPLMSVVVVELICPPLCHPAVEAHHHFWHIILALCPFPVSPDLISWKPAHQITHYFKSLHKYTYCILYGIKQQLVSILKSLLHGILPKDKYPNAVRLIRTRLIS